MKLLPALCFTATLLAQTWAPQTSNTRASLRGVSAVDARTVFASGSGGTTSGSDVSADGGKTWKLFDSGAYNAINFVNRGDGWAVGPQGRIARFQPPTN
jgi:hypothetical protein